MYVDLAAPEAAPLVSLLHGIPSALQFVLDNSLNNMKSIGSTTMGMGAVCTARQSNFMLTASYSYLFPLDATRHH
jgi:hypothetical protein